MAYDVLEVGVKENAANPPNIILAGFMGCGKSAVGRQLAEILGRRFLDMDTEIEARFGGLAISEIFARYGEAAFRASEAQLCQELSRAQGLVVATGGGAVTFPANRAALEAGGLLVCLTARPETILARLSHRNDRPLLAGADRNERVAALLAQRATDYGSIPWQIATDERSVAQIVADILERLKG